MEPPLGFVIHLPLPPKVLHPNASATWVARLAQRKRYRKAAGELAWVQMQEQRAAGRPQLDRAVIGLEYRLPRPARGGLQTHDPDNLIAWAKTAIDAMQDAGILADDRHVFYSPPQQRFVSQEDSQDLIVAAGELILTITNAESHRCPLCQRPIN
jgi:hypothetical protein